MDRPNSPRELETFQKHDVKARNIIVQCLADNVLETIKEKETARQMIETLKNTYQKTRIATQIQLQRKLRTLKFNGKVALNDYLIEFEKTITELKSAGGKMGKMESITQLLGSMPESYQPIVTALDVLFCDEDSSSVLTFDFVKSKLLAEEEMQKRFHK